MDPARGASCLVMLPAMPSLHARAQARVGLLGNPSDLYAGRALGFAIAELGAVVELASSASIELPSELFEAGWRVAAELLRGEGVDPSTRPFRLTFQSDVPFQSGLSGSSALLVAAFRAWSAWFEVDVRPSQIAEAAWRSEVDELGMLAGPLDRLVQAHEGLLAMDFTDPFARTSVRRLDPAWLPPLLLAWQDRSGTRSGDVHAPVYARWRAGDQAVREVMARLASNADTGCLALETANLSRFRTCVDNNFDLRASLFEIDAADRALVELGRSHGAAAKLPGSGGAVLFVCEDLEQLQALDAACRAVSCTTLHPTVAVAAGRLP